MSMLKDENYNYHWLALLIFNVIFFSGHACAAVQVNASRKKNVFKEN